MLTIYHNPRCSKSRQTLALIEEAGAEVEIVKYLETPPDEATLKKLLKQMGKSPREILRKGEEAYKSEGLADLGLSDGDLIAAMLAHPKLIERPIVSDGKTAVLGRPPENVSELLG